MNRNQLLELFPLGPEIPDHRLFDPVSAISGGIGLVGNVIGGITQAGAAKKAAAIQQAASQDASNKVGVAVGQANTPIAEATQNAQADVTKAGQYGVDTSGQAKAGVDENAKNANALLNPYGDAGAAAAGTLQTGLQAGGDFNKMPTMADLQMDPGFAFRLEQGQLALDRSAAAKGGAVSGAALKDLAGYSQGLASSEYQKAFDRFETNTQDRYKNLFGVSEQGRLAGTTQSGNLMDAAKTGGDFLLKGAQQNLDAQADAGKFGLEGSTQIGANTLNGAIAQGNLLTGGANAQAAGIVGGANAMAGGIAGGANAVTGALTSYQANQTSKANTATLANLLKNPAAR